MLTLVRRQARTTDLSWEKLTRLCRRTRQRIATSRSRRQQLRALSRLDDRLLADIGLTREQQMVTGAKLFWWIS
jgi:uncharacterized protein YjiS (DUF1127 family)